MKFEPFILNQINNGEMMADITVDEKRLGELIDEAIQKHLRLTLEDMEEVRRSPAAAIVRLETRVEAIEKTMATKADIAELRAEFNERISQLDSSLSGRLSQLDSKLSKHVGNVETTLGERIGNTESKLGVRIGNIETTLGERIAKLETGQKLMFSVFLSLFGGIIAMLVKLVFFP